MYELNYYFAIFLGLAIGLFAGLCYFLTSLMRREYHQGWIPNSVKEI